MLKLEFSHTYSYRAETEGISLPLVLRSGMRNAFLDAKIDSGASHCLFQRDHGEILGLDIEAGERKYFSTVTGPVETFGHVVQIETLGIAFDSMVYFFANAAINKSVLGRTGWLDRIRFGLVDYDQTLYLAPYDFESK